MLEPCENCGSVVLKGVRADAGIFCSTECRDYAAYPGFCPECLSRSSPHSAETFDAWVLGVRTALSDARERCPVCHSVVETNWLRVLYVPVLRLGEYRVKYTKPREFLSRRYSNTVLPHLPDATDDIATLREGLRSPHAEMREHCASIIGDRGPEALAAVPELEALLRDPVRRVRARAKWALETIARRHRR